MRKLRRPSSTKVSPSTATLLHKPTISALSRPDGEPLCRLLPQLQLQLQLRPQSQMSCLASTRQRTIS